MFSRGINLTLAHENLNSKLIKTINITPIKILQEIHQFTSFTHSLIFYRARRLRLCGVGPPRPGRPDEGAKEGPPGSLQRAQRLARAAQDRGAQGRQRRGTRHRLTKVSQVDFV